MNQLAPLQRVVDAQQLTVAPVEFEASLATRQDTALGRPLGHLVSPDAPGGLLRGVGVVEGAGSRTGAASGSAPVAQRAVEMPLREGAITFFGPRVGGGGAEVFLGLGLGPWLPCPYPYPYSGCTGVMSRP